MYEKVLVPLDGSKLAEYALDHVKGLFRDGAIGEITILNVVRADVQWAGMEGIGLEIFKMRETVLASAKKYLNEMASRLGSEGIKVKTEVLEGDRPASIIFEYAQKNGMDLIVIATHGYSGLKKMMFGSVAYGIIHESHIPVFLIRPPESIGGKRI